MRGVAELASIIERRVFETFNDPARAMLKPLSDNERFFLSSDVCVRLARRFSKNPDEMAQLIVSQIDQAAGERWSHHAGYINITADRSETWDLGIEPDTTSSGMRTVIYLPPRPGHQAISGMVRLAAVAFFQFSLARIRGQSVDLYYAGHKFSTADSRDPINAFNELALLCHTGRDSHYRVDREIMALYEGEVADSFCFFLCPADVDHTLWKAGGKLPGFDEKVHVHIAERGWIGQVDPVPESFDYLTSQSMTSAAMATVALLSHLSSPIRGVDIDWKMPLFAEKNNLIWKLRSLEERLSHLSISQEGGDGTQAFNIFSPGMAFFIKYLPSYAAGALIRGEMSQFISVVDETLNGIARLLNDTKLRIELAGGSSKAAAVYGCLKAPIEWISSFFYVD